MNTTELRSLIAAYQQAFAEIESALADESLTDEQKLDAIEDIIAPDVADSDDDANVDEADDEDEDEDGRD
ncbi:MAG: hypothetical protein ACYCVL_09445 [Gemmatimonadaceae bacterium]